MKKNIFKSIWNRASKQKKADHTFTARQVLILVAALCAALILISFFSESKIAPLRAICDCTVVPMEKGFNKIAIWLTDMTTNFDTLSEVRAENEALRAQVNELTADKTRLEQNEYELQRLQALFELSENYGNYPTVGARVIGSEGGNWFSKFIINKGSANGIAVDMNIIAEGGLVGIVTEVAPHYSVCRSIIDDASNVSAMTLKTSDICYVKGDLTQMNEGTIRFVDMANNKNEIPKGETIITSNISSKYLPGIIIGYINDIRIDANNLTRSGVLVPAVDFTHLQEVLVITTLKSDLQNMELEPVQTPAEPVEATSEEGDSEKPDYYDESYYTGRDEDDESYDEDYEDYDYDDYDEDYDEEYE